MVFCNISTQGGYILKNTNQFIYILIAFGLLYLIIGEVTGKSPLISSFLSKLGLPSLVSPAAPLKEYTQKTVIEFDKNGQRIARPPK